uniref:Uncharacterized protein n=1 Tax=Anopheles merus TaxID=30066 RepID=A0A182V1B9_ANOME
MFTISWCVKPSTQMSFTYTSTSPILSCPSIQAGPFGTIDLICRNSSTLSSPPTIVKPRPRIDFTSVVINRSPRSCPGFLLSATAGIVRAATARPSAVTTIVVQHGRGASSASGSPAFLHTLRLQYRIFVLRLAVDVIDVRSQPVLVV